MKVFPRSLGDGQGESYGAYGKTNGALCLGSPSRPGFLGLPLDLPLDPPIPKNNYE